MVKTAVRSYWQTQLIREASHHMTATYLAAGSVNPGKLHPAWECTPHDAYDIRQACIKVKMLSGTYWLGADQARADGKRVSTCDLCKLEPEDLEHLIVRCPAYNHIRLIYLPQIKEAITMMQVLMHTSIWEEDDKFLMRAILDINLVADEPNERRHVEDTPRPRRCTKQRMDIEHLTRKYLFLIHSHRAVAIG